MIAKKGAKHAEIRGKFYKSKAWQESRALAMKKAGGQCEQCLRNGKYNLAEIVHHKIPLTPDNINDLSISLSLSNLEALCRGCHAEAHGETQKRYKLDALGRVIFN